MPAPVVEPSPFEPADRFGAPDDAQDASYFAASARMRSLVASVGSMEAPRFVCSLYVLESAAVQERPWVPCRDPSSHRFSYGPRWKKRRDDGTRATWYPASLQCCRLNPRIGRDWAA